MGSQNRSSDVNVEESEEDDVTITTQTPSLSSPDDIDNNPVAEETSGSSPDVTSILPVPPRLRCHERGPRFVVQVLDLDAKDNPPSVPARSPISDRSIPVFGKALMRFSDVNVEESEEDDITLATQTPSLSLPDDNDSNPVAKEMDGSSLDVMSIPPVPPRLRCHERGPRFVVQVLDLDAKDNPPPVPARSPISNRLVPVSEKRPVIEPRSTTKRSNFAGVHSTPRSSRLKLTFTESEVSRSNRSLPNLRVVFDNDHPTVVLTIADLSQIEQSRNVMSPHVQLSVWPTRLPTSNLHLDDVVNVQKRSNEYVDCPTRGTIVASQAHHETSEETRIGSDQDIALVHTKDAKSMARMKPTKVKDKAKHNVQVCKERIICSRCGHCRCRECSEKHDLPRRWIGKRECSAESVVDACTCVCCARALFYHCTPTDDDGTDCSDDPCAGQDRPRCCLRWAALGLLSICLPCLCCYWPMRGVLRTCTWCYNGCCRTRGCRCRQDVPLGTKTLLPESESSSF